MSTSTYRSLLRLYPREFRRDYGDDLVQTFADLVADCGPRKAWTRTAGDLIVTVPRYRLEHIMNERHSATALAAATLALTVGGILSVLAGFYPGGVLLLAAAGLAFSQRSRLARAIGTPSSSQRRHRLGASAGLTLVFLAAALSYMRAIDSEHISNTSLLLHTAIGMAALLGAVVFFVAGLLTAASPDSATPA